MTQLSFSTLDHQNKKKCTKRERFLAEMDAVVPWALWIALIEPYYPKARNGRRPYPLEVMLRIYFLQQWYQLSDPGAEEALYDIQSMRAFVGLELGRDAYAQPTRVTRCRSR
jgi:IS5 family transposase